MPNPKLVQDPHQTSTGREKVLEVAIGREIRGFRRQKDMTVAELSGRSGVSSGMLSKIENGTISPSLTTLTSISEALSVPLTAFFRGYEEKREAVLTKANQGVEVERSGTRTGHHYQLLGHINTTTSGVVVEPYLITLTETSDTFPTFQHEGVETIYMLEGRVAYRHGDEVHELEPGDTLFFDADAPHGPEQLTELPAVFLSIIAYQQSN